MAPPGLGGRVHPCAFRFFHQSADSIGLREAIMTILNVTDLNAWFGEHHAVRGISLQVPERDVVALMGPSGCGKSTFLRCLNRLHEEVPGARVSGTVLLEGANIYDPAVDPVIIRRKIGMVFQKPNPFPTMSI